MNVKIYKDNEWVAPTREEVLGMIKGKHGISLERSKIFQDGKWVGLDIIFQNNSIFSINDN